MGSDSAGARPMGSVASASGRARLTGRTPTGSRRGSSTIRAPGGGRDLATEGAIAAPCFGFGERPSERIIGVTAPL